MNNLNNRPFDFTELGFHRFLDLMRMFSTIKYEDLQEQVDLMRFVEMPGFKPFVYKIDVNTEFRTMTIVIFDKMIDVPTYGICNFICLDQFRDIEKITTGSVSDTERNSLLDYFEKSNVEMKNKEVN